MNIFGVKMIKIVQTLAVLGLLMSSGCVTKPMFSFGIVADVQYADKDQAGSREYRESIGKLGEAVSVYNDEKLAFVVQLGDFIDGGDGAERDLRAISEVFNGIEVPKYHVLGNHDFSGIARAKVMGILGMEKAYYDFSYRKWRFVVLDTMDISVTGGWAKGDAHYRMGEKFLGELKKAGAANAVDWNGGVGPEQKEWLEGVLEDAQKRKQRVVVFGHNPLMPAGEAHTLWNSQEIVGVLESYDCVLAYLNGHRHVSDYYYVNGKYYVTLDGMVEESFDDGYAIGRVYKDRIEIESTGAVPRLGLMFEE